MRIIVFILLIGACAAYPSWFHRYKQEHNKKYTLLQEFRIFKKLRQKRRLLQRHKYEGLELRIHAGSDIDRKVNRHLASKRRRLSRGNLTRMSPAPPSFDWRTNEYVTPPKRQGRCGGCYAFAATGHLEFWYKKLTGRLIPLSIQQALDCSGPESDGCEGGLMEDVYYHSYWNPVAPESFDPWTGHDGKCRVRKRHPFVRVLSYVSMSSDYNDKVEKHLADNIYHYGPIPVAVDSTGRAFEFYHNGIVKHTQCGTEVDHAVLVVGYTPDYWIVKNSWGPSWGQDGYIYLERGHNTCGINTYASFATRVSI